MHAAVILLGMHKIFHVGGLWVFAKNRVIIGGSRVRHRTQTLAVNTFRK